MELGIENVAPKNNDTMEKAYSGFIKTLVPKLSRAKNGILQVSGLGRLLKAHEAVKK